jgi:eukaryotic-like serine/threonine-protein kinase
VRLVVVRAQGYVRAMRDLAERVQQSLGDAFQVVRALGGGMARAFLVHDVELDRDIVVKVLPLEFARGVDRQRFRREIRLAATLQHPNIVPLLTTAETPDLLSYTMPYVHGESLRHRLTSGPLPIEDALRLLRELADALAAAHAAGFVHRDIKPENVLLSHGHALVTDFGVAKALQAAQPTASIGGSLTSAGVAVGTPEYMAPEQAAGDPEVDHRADLYSLGVIGYEALAGRSPFAGRTAQRMMAAHAIERPPSLAHARPEAPQALVRLIDRLLAKNPSHRPANAPDVVRALDGMIAGGSSGWRTVIEGLLRRRGASEL